MINPFALSPTASSLSATRPYPVLSHKELGQAPDGLAFNTNTTSLYAPTSLAASTANSNAQFDYTNIAPFYAPSFTDKSRTNILTDNSQANPTNNLQLKYVVKAPQKTNIYYDGKSNIINNNSNTYYYIAAATPLQQPSYETPLYHPTQGGYYPTNGYPPVGNDYSSGYAPASYGGYGYPPQQPSYETPLYYPTQGGYYPTNSYPPVGNDYSGGYAPASYSGYGYPPQQQDNNWVNIILSVLLPLLQPKQEPNYNHTPDIINLTIKNELKDLVNLVNENKNVAKADSESVIENNDTTNNDYDYDIDNRQYETNNDYDNRKYSTTHNVTTPAKKKVVTQHPVKVF